MTGYESYSRRSNSPSNAFHTTSSAAFQPQPAYDQMAAAAAVAAAANGQDYYQHQHQQPMIYMPPVSHNPPPNSVQPTAMDHARAQPTAPVAGASPQSQSGSPGREASSTPTTRALNSSKRAEQNRKAQRAFRERRDAHIKYLESRSELLDAALQQAEESNRRWEEARGVMEVLKRENEILRCALAQYNQANNPAALGSLTLPPHNPPPRQLPSVVQQRSGQSAEDPHPILSVNPSGPGGAGPAVNSLSNEVRSLQERARELREEGARIEKIQVGTRKRRRGTGAAANMEGRNDADEVDAHVQDTMTAAIIRSAGKRKRPRAAQKAS